MQVDDLHISFYYEDWPVKCGDGITRTSKTTWCEISQVDKANDAEVILVKTGVACYFRDQYTKAVGRKRALELALRFMTKKYGMTKEKRAKIWSTYWGMSPVSKLG